MSKITFKRNPETGLLEAWKDGVFLGNVITMGDDIINQEEVEK